jgi:hypothetical protein
MPRASRDRVRTVYHCPADARYLARVTPPSRVGVMRDAMCRRTVPDHQHHMDSHRPVGHKERIMCVTLENIPSANSTGAPYVAANFAPLKSEVTSFDLEVIGHVPEEVTGRLLRIGPNPIDDLDQVRLARHHWFAGSGMVHGLRLRGGKAPAIRSRRSGCPFACRLASTAAGRPTGSLSSNKRTGHGGASQIGAPM